MKSHWMNHWMLLMVHLWWMFDPTDTRISTIEYVIGQSWLLRHCYPYINRSGHCRPNLEVVIHILKELDSSSVFVFIAIGSLNFSITCYVMKNFIPNQRICQLLLLSQISLAPFKSELWIKENRFGYVSLNKIKPFKP